jgi:hypothetical protein
MKPERSGDAPEKRVRDAEHNENTGSKGSRAAIIAARGSAAWISRQAQLSKRR